MDASWDDRIAAFWASADDEDPTGTLAGVRDLVAERHADDPAALFELASAHDFLGREAEAVPLYRAALDAGLSGAREPRARIQLASSLRNIGDAQAAVALLEQMRPAQATGTAAEAFRALALFDLGQPAAALRVALEALAPSMPMYSRAVLHYAGELDAGRERRDADHQ